MDGGSAAADANVGGTLTINLDDVSSMSVELFEGTGTVHLNDGGVLAVDRFNFSGTINVNEDAEIVVVEDAIQLVGSYIGTLNVDGTGATVLFKTSRSRVGTLRITDTGLVTLQARTAAPTSSIQRVLIVNDLDLGPAFSETGPTGKLDLKDNALIVKYLGGSLYDTVKQLLIKGYDDVDAGRWDGLGIVTSLAVTTAPTTSLGYAEADDFNITSFAGETIDYDAVLVKYTFEGDANLDGVVNVADLGILASHWQEVNRDWREANFNYDYYLDPPSGNVDVADLGIVASNWQAGVENYNGPSFDECWDELH
jgi:hypothetical protein